MSKSGKYYNQLAEIYDSATEKDSVWTPPSYIYNKIKKHTNKNCNILDIGIGTGKSIEKIYRTSNYSTITGVDTSSEMLSICREKYPDIDLLEINSIKELENVSKKFELIMCSGAFEFIDNADIFFNQCKRLLSESGIFIFTYEPIIDYHSIQKDRKSLTVGDTKSDLYIENFYTYRYRPSEISSYLTLNNFELTSDDEFISYVKSGEKIVYHCVQAKNHK